MSTLTALQLQRELEITRRAMAQPERPKLVMQWTIDPRSGRPAGVWTASEETASPTIMPEPGIHLSGPAGSRRPANRLAFGLLQLEEMP